MHLTRSQLIRYAGKIVLVSAKIASFSATMAIKVVSTVVSPQTRASGHSSASQSTSSSSSRQMVRLLDGSYVKRKIRHVNHGKELLHVITYKNRQYVVIKTGKNWRLVR